MLHYQMVFALNVSVDVNSNRGTADGRHYGVGLWSAMNPNDAENVNYRARLTDVAPRTVRYHSGDQIANGRPQSWVNYTTQTWDRARIKRVLHQRPPSATQVLMNISNWPGWISTSSNRKLDADKVDAFATLCADLATIVNIEGGYGVRYWEPMNEIQDIYRSDMATFAAIFDRVVVAMKARDPTLKIVGAAWNQPYDDDNINVFLSNITTTLDVFSYHSYTSVNNSDRASIYNGANIASGVSHRKSRLAPYPSAANAELWVDERASHYACDLVGATLMSQGVGAVYDALAIKSIAEQGVVGAAHIFNDADGTFGLWNTNGTWKPAGRLFALLNAYGIGTILTNQTANAQKIQVFAIRSGANVTVVLVNRSLVSQSVDVDAAFTPERRWIVGDTSSDAAISSLSGISVPADSIAVVRGRVATGVALGLDVDGNGASDAATDGRLTLRYLMGYRGDALVANRTIPSATTRTAAQIESYLAGKTSGASPAFKITAASGGVSSPFVTTDGLLILRYLLGIAGPALTNGIPLSAPLDNASKIAAYLLALQP